MLTYMNMSSIDLISHPIYAKIPSMSPCLTLQQRRRQAVLVLAAAPNAAVSRSLWMREQSDNWWELEVGAGDQ